MINKTVFLALVLVFTLAYSTSIGGVMAWSNITCIDGNAHKVLNGTWNENPQIWEDVEYCGDLDCVNGLGCIDPRETPGEMFLAMILIFVLGSAIFGYLSMKITSDKHFPIRLIFFFMSIILIMTGSLMSYLIAFTLGHFAIANVALTGFIGILIVFIFVLLLQIKEFIVWVIESLRKAKNAGQEDDFDGV